MLAQRDWAQLPELDYEARIRRLARWIDEAEREGRRYRLQLPGQPALGPASGALGSAARTKSLSRPPANRPAKNNDRNIKSPPAGMSPHKWMNACAVGLAYG